MQVVGNYSIEFNQEENCWKSFHKGNLIAVTPESIWSHSNVAFNSQQAGDILLGSIIELTGNFDSKKIDKVNNLEKTDEGDVKDELTPSEKIEDNNPSTEEEIIIIKIEALLNEILLANSEGLSTEASLKELDVWQERFITLQSNKLKKEMNDLMKQAEKDILKNIDCTATLDRIEQILKVLSNGRN